MDLHQLTAHGHMRTHWEGDILCARADRTICERWDRPVAQIPTYLALPGAYRIPFRMALEMRLDVPALFLLIGGGHINIGHLWSDCRRIDDPLAPRYKTRFYHSDIPLGEWVRVEVIYGSREMQIRIDGEERYYGKKEPYMKALAGQSDDGLPVKIALHKGASLCLRSLAIEPYDDAPIARDDEPLPTPVTWNIAIPWGEKPTFEACIQNLPEAVKNEVLETDRFLRAMRPMRFRRTLEKHGNKVTYIASDEGISYAMYLSNDRMEHGLQWYIVMNGTPDTWAQKADNMLTVLDALAQEEEAFAQRMFDSLSDCSGCSPRCLAPRKYTYSGQTRVACHASLRLTMRLEDFAAARRFLAMANRVHEQQG